MGLGRGKLDIYYIDFNEKSADGVSADFFAAFTKHLFFTFKRICATIKEQMFWKLGEMVWYGRFYTVTLIIFMLR